MNAYINQKNLRNCFEDIDHGTIHEDVMIAE